MVDLAVGMIIGSAFTSIVNSLVNDIFMPVLSIFYREKSIFPICLLLWMGINILPWRRLKK